MPRPDKLIQGLSPGEIGILFLKDFARNTTSKDARSFLKALQDKVNASDFPSEQMEAAQKILDCLTGLFDTQANDTFKRKTEAGLKPSPPSGMVWAPEGGLILADDFNHRIQIYDADRNLKIQFGSKGKAAGQFQYPKGIALDKNGHLYVADGWNHRVQKFDLEGNFISAFGEFGEGPGQMNEPWDVLVDSSGHVIVVERYNHRIQFFDDQGNSLGWTGQRATVFEDQLAFIYETSDALLPRPALEFPTSIDQDRHGNFFLTDSANHRVLKFDSEWNLVHAFGVQGDAPGEFQYPMSLSVNDAGLVYVADLNNNRIQKFTGEGVFIESFSEGEGGAALKMPGLVLAGEEGKLYVAPTLNPDLYEFHAPSFTAQQTYEALTALQPGSIQLHLNHSKHLEATGDLESAYTVCRQAVALFGKDETLPALSEKTESLPCDWARLSRTTGKGPVTAATQIKALMQLGTLHNQRREHMLKQFEEWTDFLPQYCGRLVEEQNKTLAHNEDPLEFDHTLFDLKSRDKALFHSTRLAMVDYRESVETIENAVHATLSIPADDDLLSQLMPLLGQGYSHVGNLLLQLLKRKERNEEFLIRTLQDEKGAQEHWAEFVANHSISNRISEQVRQLLNEFLALARLLDTASKLFPEKTPVRETLHSVLWQEPEAHLFGQVLLGFQEDPDLATHLQGVYLGLLDGWQNHVRPEAPPVASFTGDDIAAFEFDREIMSPEELTRAYRIGGSPIQFQTGGVVLGGELYPLESIAGKESDIGSRLESILQNQSIYNEKTTDLVRQSGELRQQKHDLETRLLSVDVRDKATPIQIGNNVRVIDFQINLLQRMIQTLAVNEANNFVRLVIGISLLSASDVGKAIVSGLDLPTRIHKLLDDEQKRLHQLKQEWKDIGLFRVGLQGRLAAIANQLEPEKVKEIEALQKQVAEADFNYLQKTSTVHRQASLTGLLGKLDAVLNPDDATSETLTFSHYVGSFAHAPQALLFPFGIAHLENGDLLVADNLRHTVVRYSPDGVHRNRFGRFGNGPAALCQPFGLAVSPDQTVYVADHGNRRVAVFDAEGRFKGTLGNSGAEENRVGSIFSLATDSDGNLWVPDTDQHRILVFSPSGELQRVMGKTSEQATDVLHPVAVCPLKDGGFVVSDRSESVIKRFDKDGVLIKTFDTTAMPAGEAYSVIHHPDHGLLVSDTYHCQTLCLDLDFNIKWAHRQTGRRSGQMLRIGGLSIHNNQLYVADYDNIRVQIFDL